MEDNDSIVDLSNAKSVTSEMVSAGVSPLDFFGETYPSDFLVVEIYRAMLAVRTDSPPKDCQSS